MTPAANAPGVVRRLLPALAVLAATGAQAAALPAGPAVAPPPTGPVRLAADAVTTSCGRGPCRVRPPGPADRDVRPFEGRLGRPCGWRQRETPSGPRRVRVCY